MAGTGVQRRVPMILNNYSAAEYGERMAIERARIPRDTSDDWYTVARRKEAAPVYAPVAAQDAPLFPRSGLQGVSLSLRFGPSVC